MTKLARRLRPRPSTAAPPLVVSDQTAFDLVGLTARQLRDLLAAHPDVPRARVGRRVLVRADVLLALVDRLASPASPDVPVGSPATVDDLLAELGRRSA